MGNGKQSQSRLWELESRSWTEGVAQSLVFDIASLPRNHRVTAFLLVCDFNVTTAGATGARPSDTAGLLLDFIEHSSEFLKVRATGYALDRLNHHMMGKKVANTVIGAAIAKARAMVTIPIVDPRSVKPSDCAIPTEMLNGTQIEVKTTTATAVQMWGAAAVATGAFRLFAALCEGAGPVDPAATRIDFEDWGGQTINLKPGVFTHLSLYKDRVATTVAAGITPDTEVTRINFAYEGQPILNNVLSWASVLEFNRAHVYGGFEDNNTEQLDDTSVPFLPCYTPPQLYSLGALPGGKERAQLQLSGSLTSLRALYRQVTFKTIDQIEGAARKMGIPISQPVTRSLKTATKVDVAGGSNSPEDIARRSHLSQLIPGRLS